MKVSIITINYNNAVGLGKTIQSVINQDYSNIEYIIIDGGSTDNSREIILENKEKIYYWVSEKDRGIYHAMNKGINISTGSYLLFLNSGDVLADGSVIKKVVLDLDTDLVMGNMQFINTRKLWEPKETLTFDHFCFGGIPHPSTFIKRELFFTVGYYDENLSIVSDWKFFLLALCKFNCSYKHLDLLITNFDEDGISSNAGNLSKIMSERDSVLNEHFKAFIKNYQELWDARKQLRKLRYTIKIKKIFGIR